MKTLLHILHLEDSIRDAELIASTLTEGGIANKIDCVERGADFIAALEKGGMDLILSDYNLPAYDGLSALALARQRCPRIPFIFVSGAIGEETAIETLKNGATDYVLKGRLSRLVPAVRRALSEAEDKAERERLKPALQESEDKFQQLAENINAVFWLSDVGTNKIYYASPMYEKIWGKSCQSLYEDPRSFLEAIHPDDRHRLISALESKETQASFDIEYRVVRPDKTFRWIRARSFPVNDKNGTLYRICGIAEDVTERKQLEEQYRQSQKMDAFGQLAGGIAHDFNNLLTVINGYSEMSLTTLSPEQSQGSSAEEILKAGQRAQALVRQLLTFSRRQISSTRVFSLNELILDADKMLRRLIPTNIEYVTLPSEPLDSVQADPGNFEQVLMNLVVNATHAVPNGGKISIRTKNVRRETGEFVLLTVSDTGTGMTEEVKKHLFEPFFTTKEAGKGTGLGLATIFGIVKQSGGSIEVDSVLGKGTTFNIYLPAVKGKAGALRENKPTTLPLGTESILVVDDEELVRTFTASALRKQGYDVLEASNGTEALETIKKLGKKAPVLVLTDMVMPQMGGKDLADRLKKSHPNLKVIYTSGYFSNPTDGIKMSENFLQKPYSLFDLANKVRVAIDAS